MHVDLDSREVMLELDSLRMLEHVEGFPAQCRAAVELARSFPLKPMERRPGLVIVAGMGGSAIGGDFARVLAEDQGSAPILVNRDNKLPNFVGVGDLVVCVSYSGDTWETLEAYATARRSGARLIAITSGGALRDQAERDGVECLLIPAGLPPRAALGYLFLPLIVILETFGVLPPQPLDATFGCKDLEAISEPVISNPAKQLALKLHGMVPILYGVGSAATAVLQRWRTQMNENAKQLAFVSAYPELDHNEVMGWIGASKQGLDRCQGILLTLGLPRNYRLRRRAEHTVRLLDEDVPFSVQGFNSQSALESLLWAVHFGDWLSLYLARLNHVDPGSIDRIEQLKESRRGKKPRRPADGEAV